MYSKNEMSNKMTAILKQFIEWMATYPQNECYLFIYLYFSHKYGIKKKRDNVEVSVAGVLGILFQ